MRRLVLHFAFASIFDTLLKREQNSISKLKDLLEKTYKVAQIELS